MTVERTGTRCRLDVVPRPGGGRETGDRIRFMRMYTGRGDSGATDLLGERTAKDGRAG